MLRMIDRHKIYNLSLKGLSMREIARITGYSRTTVTKYVRQFKEIRQEAANAPDDSSAQLILDQLNEPARRDESKGRKKKKLTKEIDERIDQILEKEKEKAEFMGSWKKQKMNSAQIHRLLVKEGFDISYGTVNAAVRKKTEKSREAFIAQVYDYGQRFEFDYGEIKLSIKGKSTKVCLAVIACPASGYRWATLCKSQSYPVFEEILTDFFDFTQGAPEEFVFDNMRNAVSSFGEKFQKTVNKNLAALASWYGFQINLTNIRSGNEKGTVERSVEVVRKEAFAHTWRFNSIQEAESWLQQQLKELNARDGRDVRFEEEKKHLKPIYGRYETARYEKRKVNKLSMIQVDSCSYSVGDHLVGEEVTVKIFSDRIVICYNGEIVAQHPKLEGKNKKCTDIRHYLRTFEKKPGALRNSLQLRSVPELKHMFDSYFTKEPKTFIKLLQKYEELNMEDLIAQIQAEIFNKEKPEKQEQEANPERGGYEENLKNYQELNSLFYGGNPSITPAEAAGGFCG